MKHYILILALLFSGYSLKAQSETADNLKKKYTIKKGFETMVNIRIDVPGLTIPPKDISVFYENGKKPIIKGKGILLLPKNGFLNQISDLLNVSAHWIEIENKGDLIRYKLVSLDPKSDWVTADIKILKANLQIDEINLTTKETGVYLIKHSYGNGVFPIATEISFLTNKFNVPLKFIGKSSIKEVKDKDGKVKGKIFLKFTNFKIL
ncbi:MAG TPA: hypothetical protein VN182_05945 [Flavobacterium sp.]|jgi:hypothetical protein|nr:hypothetical protein [Flavobacterium sp.]